MPAIPDPHPLEGTVTCPTCGRWLKVPALVADTRFRCPGCDAEFGGSRDVGITATIPAALPRAPHLDEPEPAAPPDIVPSAPRRRAWGRRVPLLALYLLLLAGVIAYYLIWPPWYRGPWERPVEPGEQIFTRNSLWLILQICIMLGSQALALILCAALRPRWERWELPGWGVFAPIGVLGALVCVLGTVAVEVKFGFGSPGAFAGALWFVGCFFASQLLFLTSAPQLRSPRPHQRWLFGLSLLTSLFGIIFLVSNVMVSLRILDMLLQPSRPFSVVGVWLAMAACWIFGAFAFVIAWRGTLDTAFRRVYQLLFICTVLELLISISINLLVRHHPDHQLFNDSTFALGAGTIGLLWLFGPGVVLFCFERRPRPFQGNDNCRACGVNLRHWSGPFCPACGAPFHRRPRA
jgi:hypothetical protein